MKRLTINADDLGASTAINTAIIELAQLGRIQSASLMTGGCLKPDELAALRESQTDIGLHFDLTGFSGEPLKRVILRSLMRAWRKDTLRRVISEQLSRFEEMVQCAPDFIDGHQHVHQLPQVRDALLEAVERRYGSLPFRITRPYTGGLKAQIIYTLGGRGFSGSLKKHHMPHNDFFGGVTSFSETSEQLADMWRQWLDRLPEAHTAIMCHPATRKERGDEIATARVREYQWLKSPDFLRLVNESGTRLCHWHDIQN